MKTKEYNLHFIVLSLLPFIAVIVSACDKLDAKTVSPTANHQRELKYASSITMINGLYKIDTNIILANRNKRELVTTLVAEELVNKSTVEEIPDFIKTFCMNVSNGKEFSMANPGEKFQEGWFDLGKGVPTRQLIYFGLGKDIALFSYYSGGIRRRQNLLIIKFEGNKILDLWFDNYGVDVKTKDEMMEYLKNNRTRNGNC